MRRRASASTTCFVLQMREWSTQLANERLERKELEDRDMADYWAYLERVKREKGRVS